ncbi:MAG TPA: DoxX family protein, partial [Candidatus Dormibacteraeota bacterium]|nr:DoxX family protein [Candidatus Dormibacteraeota bacterium]
MTYALWILQILLGLLFLFSGSMKFVMSVAEMTKDMPSMPGWFLHFIGVMEILGGFGLILPSLLRIRPGLTPLAAACLVIIMSGATAITLGTMGFGAAMLPL